MHEQIVSYEVNGIPCEGFLAYEGKTSELRPAILVAHAWYGQDQFAREKAKALAKLGYIGFAADLFGHKKNASNDDEATALIKPLYIDRKLLQSRIIAAYDTLIKQPFVDKTRIGAIGFCFGGLTVIELLRSGTPVKSVVSFHAVLGQTGAQTVPIAKGIKGSILILHGYDDPLVPIEDVLRTQRELNEAGVDWQMDVYGHTSHAFTNPQAHDKSKGLIYNEKVNERAWLSMKNFFEETLA